MDNPSGYTNPAEELEDGKLALARYRQINAVTGGFDYATALNAANFARYYTTASDELTAGVAQAAMSWDMPLLSDAVEAERDQGWAPWNAAVNAAKYMTRNSFNTIESIWENGASRPLRTAVRMTQGEGLDDAWNRAGADPLSRMARATAQGQDYTLGEGWIPQAQDGFQQENLVNYRQQLEQATADGQTMTPEVARSAWYQTQDANQAVDIYRDYWSAAENTLASRQFGDETVSTPVSFGRLAAIHMVKPDTVPFTIMSGSMDALARVTLDPLNVPADEATKAVMSRKLIVPAPSGLDEVRQYRWLSGLEDEAITPQTPIPGKKRGQKLFGQHQGTVGIEGGHTVKFDPEAIEKHVIDRTLMSDQAGSPYWDAIDDLGYSHDDVVRMVDEAGPEGAKDLVIEHERIHMVRSKAGEDMYENMGRLTDELNMKSKLADSIEDELEELVGTGGAGSPKSRELSEELGKLDDELELLNTAHDEMRYHLEYQTQAEAWENFVRGDLYSKRARDAATKSLGMQSKWRPWVSPTTPDRWAGMGAGRRMLNFLAETKSPRDVFTHLPDMPPQVLKQVIGAETADDVLAILKPHLGHTTAQTYPTVGRARAALGARVPIDEKRGAAGGFSVMDDDSTMGRWWRREKSSGAYDGTELDPMDPGTAMDNTINYLDTLGATSDEIDDVLLQIMDTNHDFGRMMGVANKIDGIVERRLLELGEHPEDVRHIMETYRKQTITHAVYIDDASGNPIHVLGNATAKIKSSSGRELKWVVPEAAREAQFTGRNILLPSVRDVRQVTGKVRVTMDKFRKMRHPDDIAALGFDKAKWNTHFTTWMRYKADQFMAVWRDAALLRLGWPLRVLPDEYLRILASGYGDMFSNPGSYIAFMTMDGQGLTGNLDDWIRAKNGLGTGTLARDANNAQLQGTRHQVQRTSMKFAREGEYGFDQGVARGMAQIHRGRLPKMLLAETEDGVAGIDGVMAQLWDGDTLTDLGHEVLDQIVADVNNPNNRQFARINRSPRDTRRALQMAEFDLASYSGGKGFYRQRLPDGTPTQNWMDIHGDPIRTYTDLKGPQLRAELHSRGIPIPKDRRTNAAMIKMLREADGTAMLDDLGPTQQFYTSDLGSPRIHKVIRDGVDDEFGTLIKEEMNQRDWLNLEANVLGLYDEIYPVRTGVWTPDPEVTAQMKTWGNQLVETAFIGIGSSPTRVLMRQPMFKMRYTENLAEYYLWTDKSTRTAIREWASSQGVLDEFNTFVKKRTELRGIKDAPTGILGLTIEEIDELARFNALDHVKNLLYDLSKTSNVMDALRLVVPFGDAWFEVLSRWAALYNPARQGGQVARNLRRPAQVAYQGRQEGWFQEDEFGNEVFNYPIPIGGFEVGRFKVQPKVSVSQFMFVDPGNPRSVMLPGTGPLIQLPASFATPRLPTPVRDLVQWGAFGNFAPGDTTSVGGIVMSVLPTPYKRVIQRFVEDEHRKDMANEKVQAFYGLCNSSDRRFDCSTEEGSQRAQDEANKIAGWLGWVRLFDAVASPAQPQYKMEVDVTGGASMSEINRLSQEPDTFAHWLSVGALSREYRTARELFGDDEAQKYMMNRFGVDPLELGSTSMEVLARPATRNSFIAYEKLPEDVKKPGGHAFYSLMAFLPQDEDDDFYGYAYTKQVRDGARIKYTEPRQVAQLQSLYKANRVYEHNKEIYDRQVEVINQQFAMYPATRKERRAELDQWWSDVKFDIGQQYTQFAPGVEIEGRVDRPSYGNYIEELRDIGDPMHAANSAMTDVNPELVGWIENVMGLWAQAEQYSMERGTQSTWWRRAPLESDLDPGEVDSAVQIQQWFVDGMNHYLAGITDPIALTGAQWLADRVFTGALGVYDLDDPLMLEGSPPPSPSENVIAGDTINRNDLVGAAP